MSSPTLGCKLRLGKHLLPSDVSPLPRTRRLTHSSCSANLCQKNKEAHIRGLPGAIPTQFSRPQQPPSECSKPSTSPLASLILFRGNQPQALSKNRRTKEKLVMEELVQIGGDFFLIRTIFSPLIQKDLCPSCWLFCQSLSRLRAGALCSHQGSTVRITGEWHGLHRRKVLGQRATWPPWDRHTPGNPTNGKDSMWVTGEAGNKHVGSLYYSLHFLQFENFLYREEKKKHFSLKFSFPNTCPEDFP